MTRNGWYVIFLVVCLMGWAYLGAAYYFSGAFEQSGFGVCLFKNLSGYPCPSCGTTRAVFLILHGHWRDAFLMNPLGYAVVALLTGIPLGLLYDWMRGKSVLYRGLQRTIDLFLRHRWLLAVVVGLVLLNGIWNLCKGV